MGLPQRHRPRLTWPRAEWTRNTGHRTRPGWTRDTGGAPVLRAAVLPGATLRAHLFGGHHCRRRSSRQVRSQRNGQSGAARGTASVGFRTSGAARGAGQVGFLRLTDVPEVSPSPPPTAGRPLWARLSVAVWLAFVAYPLSATYGASHVTSLHLAVVVATAALFCVVYVAYAALPDATRSGMDRRSVLAVAFVLAGAVTFLIFYDGPDWAYSYVYCLWPAVTAARGRPWPIAFVTGIALAAGAAGGLGGPALASAALVVVGVGAGIYGVVRLVAANDALRQAQADHAAAAVAEERLRFARDLHELLGHSLSVIALKSQVACRLLADQPQRAAKEIGDVERITQQALQEVREAVSGYRRPTLKSELESASRALAAAGIHMRQAIRQPCLPTTAESVLAWALREAVTNVVRHSKASTCTVSLDVSATAAVLTVTDDGVGPGDPRADSHLAGNGLRGLSERLRAAGGTVQAAPGDSSNSNNNNSSSSSSGGFRLSASVPLPPGWTAQQLTAGSQTTSVSS